MVPWKSGERSTWGYMSQPDWNMCFGKAKSTVSKILTSGKGLVAVYTMLLEDRRGSMYACKCRPLSLNNSVARAWKQKLIIVYFVFEECVHTCAVCAIYVTRRILINCSLNLNDTMVIWRELYLHLFKNNITISSVAGRKFWCNLSPYTWPIACISLRDECYMTSKYKKYCVCDVA